MLEVNWISYKLTIAPTALIKKLKNYKGTKTNENTDVKLLYLIFLYFIFYIDFWLIVFMSLSSDFISIVEEYSVK